MRKMVLAVITLTAFLSLIPIAALQAACYPDNNNSPCEGNFDRDCDVDGSDAALFKTDFGRSPFSNPCPPSGNAMVPKTGQTTSYATGDDGDLEKGVPWPIPRFTDNGNGTVTDNLTGLIWLKNADCVGPQTWDYALLVSSGITDGVCGLTDGSKIGDWRLPNRFELESLLDMKYGDPTLSNTAGTGQWAPGDPFINVHGFYWTSTTYAIFPAHKWYVSLLDGNVLSSDRSDIYFVWPVRGGQ